MHFAKKKIVSKSTLFYHEVYFLTLKLPLEHIGLNTPDFCPLWQVNRSVCVEFTSNVHWKIFFISCVITWLLQILTNQQWFLLGSRFCDFFGGRPHHVTTCFCLSPFGSETYRLACDWLTPSLPDSLPPSLTLADLLKLWLCCSSNSTQTYARTLKF